MYYIYIYIYVLYIITNPHLVLVPHYKCSWENLSEKPPKSKGLNHRDEKSPWNAWFNITRTSTPNYATVNGNITTKYGLIWYSTSILGSWNSHWHSQNLDKLLVFADGHQCIQKGITVTAIGYRIPILGWMTIPLFFCPIPWFILNTPGSWSKWH